MTDLARMLIFTSVAGACIPLGGWLASLEHIRPKWLETEFRHFVMAFGGGVLLAAVTLVLIPQGLAELTEPSLAVGLLLGGGVAFFFLESWLGSHQQDAPQMMAMLLDFVPESLALGGLFVSGSQAAPFLALLIGLQNLPEGFNAFREMSAKGHTTGRVLYGMSALVLLGPLSAWAGWALLGQHPGLLAGMMLFASGGLLYLIFQDIAPKAVLRRHWFPSLGAVTGFSLALMGQLTLGV